MSASKDVILKLADDKRTQSIKEYTDKALQNPELAPQEKIKLVELNQENRLSIIKRVQKHTYEHLFQKHKHFYTKIYHYDWWMFPMHVPTTWNWPKRNYDASIDMAEAKVLLTDSDFVDIYLSSVTLYIHALKSRGWNDYPVRYARMLHSLALFINAARDNGVDTLRVKMQVLGQEALAYAKECVAHLYPEYDLLQKGLQATAAAVLAYLPTEEGAFACMSLQ